MKKNNKKVNEKKANNKKIKIIILILICIIIVLSSINIKNNKVSKDERKFKVEYEKYNNKKNIDKEKYIKLDIPDQNNIKYVTANQVINIMKNKTGIIYFGFPQSNWSRSMINTLIEATNEENVNTIYYLNAYGIRDEKYIYEDSVLTVKKGTDEYYKILKLLGDKAQNYEELENSDLKRLYFPTVIFVRKGKVVSIHTSTVSSHKNYLKEMNKKQKEELKLIYTKGIEKMCKDNKSC